MAGEYAAFPEKETFMPKSSGPVFRVSIALLAFALLPVACTAAVTTEQPAPQGLPRPDIVIVHDFADGRADAVDRTLADSLARQLVDELKGRGIVAYRAATAPEPTLRTITIEGRFVDFREEGRPRKKAHIRFSSGTLERPRLLQQAETAFSDSFDPARLIAEDGADREELRHEFDGETAKMAGDIGSRMETYYRRQGWLH
jgi:hypothetical protein